MNFIEAYEQLKKGKVVQRLSKYKSAWFPQPAYPRKLKLSYDTIWQLGPTQDGGTFEEETEITIQDLDATDWGLVE